jgi:hypothetical protein
MASRSWAGNRVSLFTLALLSLVTIAAWVGVVNEARTMAAADADMGSGMMFRHAGPLGTVAGLATFIAAWVVWTPYGVAFVLLAAGAYQFTALKLRCLRSCQSPLHFLMVHWKAGRWGALRMGLEHGAYCSACCWGLMAVLVAAGAMGLRWVLLVALVVAAEKLLPRGEWAAWITGALLLALGAAVVINPELARALHA